jgi:hypothetical protein
LSFCADDRISAAGAEGNLSVGFPLSGDCLSFADVSGSFGCTPEALAGTTSPLFCVKRIFTPNFASSFPPFSPAYCPAPEAREKEERESFCLLDCAAVADSSDGRKFGPDIFPSVGACRIDFPSETSSDSFLTRSPLPLIVALQFDEPSNDAPTTPDEIFICLQSLFPDEISLCLQSLFADEISPSSRTSPTDKS